MPGVAYSVSQLTELIRGRLEGAFPDVAVEGEVSNCRPSSTGHLYFTLKDAGATLSAVMFKNRLRGLNFSVVDGLLIRARGSISVYAQRGSYQIICESLERAGQGDLLALLEERKRRLAAEGLFDSDRKRPIPRFPRKVGVITSPTGAAIRDILNILRRRAGIDVVVLPAPVQGTEAAPIIVRRLEQANHWQLADVLILARGGGSIEDLLPFSEEAVVRAIASSSLPVISAVGHEIDWALSDYVADLRAPTPSAAAELVSADQQALRLEIQARIDDLTHRLDSRLERIRLLLKPFSDRDLEFRFRALLQPHLVRFDDAKEGLCDALLQRLDGIRQIVALADRTLMAMNPLSILDRGFSLVTDEATGLIVRDAAAVAPGQRLSVRPAHGRYTVAVAGDGGQA